MPRRFLSVLPVLAALAVGAAPAIAQTGTVTATGTGQVKVSPQNRHSNSSIVAAVDKAQQAAIPAAIGQAHEYALQYAQAAGLTLGSIFSISDTQSGLGQGYFYGPYPTLGVFGPNKYCAVIGAHVIKRISGPGHKVTVVKVKRRRVCDVPPYATSTLTVTYSTT